MDDEDVPAVAARVCFAILFLHHPGSDQRGNILRMFSGHVDCILVHFKSCAFLNRHLNVGSLFLGAPKRGFPHCLMLPSKFLLDDGAQSLAR